MQCRQDEQNLTDRLSEWGRLSTGESFLDCDTAFLEVVLTQILAMKKDLDLILSNKVN